MTSTRVNVCDVVKLYSVFSREDTFVFLNNFQKQELRFLSRSTRESTTRALIIPSFATLPPCRDTRQRSIGIKISGVAIYSCDTRRK